MSQIDEYISKEANELDPSNEGYFLSINEEGNALVLRTIHLFREVETKLDKIHFQCEKQIKVRHTPFSWNQWLDLLSMYPHNEYKTIW